MEWIPDASVCFKYGARRRGEMPKVFCLMLIMLLGAANLPAATLAGVTLPDSADAGGKSLVLNGIALRTKMGVKIVGRILRYFLFKPAYVKNVILPFLTVADIS
jgi:hypothetical protein